MLVRNPWRGVGSLPAAVWLVFATTLVNRAGTMVVPFMALYVTRYLGVRPALGGLALSVYGVGGLVSGPIAGRLCDQPDRGPARAALICARWCSLWDATLSNSSFKVRRPVVLCTNSRSPFRSYCVPT